MSGRQQDEVTEGGISPAKTLPALPPDDPVVAAIQELYGNAVLADKRTDVVQMGSEPAHGRPSGIKILSDPLIIDIVRRKLIDAAVDEA